MEKGQKMPTDAKASPLPHLTTAEERSESPDQRMADADVLVTHSSRYAVALEYQPGRMSAPRVLARGMDRCADRVRELARRHGVPTVEDPMLAEALYHHTAPDEIIPEALYHAVARVMAYLTRLRRRQPASYVPLRQPPQLDSDPNED
jgi:flagellar biosynthetic protein FlhB